MNLAQNKCLKCGKLVSGRSDKKFCDRYCRNTFNNQSKNEEELFISNINKIIRKNRRILKTLSPEGKAIVRKEILDQLGFNYNIFSSLHKTKLGLYYLNYDYGFRALIDNGKEKVQIIQKQDYMSKFDPWD